jgi:trehalose/maltose transport system substrate-binding protein
MRKLCLGLILMLSLSLAQQDVTLRWMTSGVGSEFDFSQALIARYEAMNPHIIGGESYNVTIVPFRGPESTTDRFGLYLQYFETQSDEIDIFNIDVIWPGDLAEHLVDLNQFDWTAESIGQHFPAIVENNTVDGALVAYPWYVGVGLLYYRTDLLEAYGFEAPPTTWQELTEMAQVIQDGERAAGNPDFWGFVWQGNAYEGLTCDALEWIASYNGGTVISPDGVITVNNPNAIAAIELAASWVGTISPPGVTGYQEEDARNVFQGGNAAFMRNWPYAYFLGQADDSPIAGRFDVSALPAGPDGQSASALGGWMVAVSRYSANPKVAAHFANYVASYEEQLGFAIETSNMPTIPEVYTDPALLASEMAWLSGLLPAAEGAVARPSTVSAPQYAEVSRLFFSAVHDVLTGRETAATALGVLELDLEALTGFPVGSP